MQRWCKRPGMCQRRPNNLLRRWLCSACWVCLLTLSPKGSCLASGCGPLELHGDHAVQRPPRQPKSHIITFNSAWELFSFAAFSPFSASSAMPLKKLPSKKLTCCYPLYASKQHVTRAKTRGAPFLAAAWR
ncbi:hypothetical protein EJ02DRAFT_134996 [Clathrospora elynae]|uniref:Secreted protein n=1 Tax=Clathrospora elynae TaxID=706981 RepID=A0A6A5S3U0_9PLEO|nr:hypothetical protein EJ02DRAFT_134996 [Clathrospora elynae]